MAGDVLDLKIEVGIVLALVAVGCHEVQVEAAAALRTDPLVVIADNYKYGSTHHTVGKLR